MSIITPSGNMFGAGAYFSTKQLSRAAPDGWWTITHSELNRKIFNTWLNLGRPQGPWGPSGPTYMSLNYMLSWTEMKQLFQELILDHKDDPMIIDMIKRKIIDIIPIRSGHLADFIFKSLRISRVARYTSHYMVMIWFYPFDRPKPVPGNVKHAGETGYGEWGTVKITEPLVIAKVHVIEVLPSGNAKYELNDPIAYNDVEVAINNEAVKIMLDYMFNVFANLVITCHY